MYNALCALNFPHSSKVVHGNISPKNLVVDPNCQVHLKGFNNMKYEPEEKSATRIMRTYINQHKVAEK